jgi:hypothetical protein
MRANRGPADYYAMADVALLLVGYSHEIVSDITDIVPRRR